MAVRCLSACSNWRLRFGKGVTLHELLELWPGVAGKQRIQHLLICFDDLNVRRNGIQGFPFPNIPNLWDEKTVLSVRRTHIDAL